MGRVCREKKRERELERLKSIFVSHQKTNSYNLSNKGEESDDSIQYCFDSINFTINNID